MASSVCRSRRDDHLLRDAGRSSHVRITRLDACSRSILRRDAIALAPEPVVLQDAFDRFGPPRQRQVARRHLGRHDAHHVVLADDAIESLTIGLLRADRSRQSARDTCPGTARTGAPRDPQPWLAIRPRSCGSRRVCGAGPRGRINSKDSTRCGTLSSSTSKSCRGEIGDGRAVDRDVGVEPHEVGAATKARLLLRLAAGRRG